jgi:dolichol-phosphate mannosyltransferase/undecaprenyl-phosphate 4-deoxy-4-formamido-L-arabinose transferase
MSENLVSIVIPVYKSAESLVELAERIRRVFNATDRKYELIFVNDSPAFDETRRTLEGIQSADGAVKVIRMRKNEGQHLATLVGLSHSRGDVIVTLDDDLQHPVESIPSLLEVLMSDSELECIFAIPEYSDRKHSHYRNAGSYILSVIDTLFLEKPEGLVKSSYRVMKREIVDVLLSRYNAMPSITSILISITHNIKNVTVPHHARIHGASGYSLSKLISLTLNNLLHYSSLPLKFMGYLGLGGFFSSVVFIMVAIFRKLLFQISIPGYASTICLISLFGGLNLFALGIIGEYLIRIIREQQKPRLDSLAVVQNAHE